VASLVADGLVASDGTTLTLPGVTSGVRPQM
jgi:hypothetical protein